VLNWKTDGRGTGEEENNESLLPEGAPARHDDKKVKGGRPSRESLSPLLDVSQKIEIG